MFSLGNVWARLLESRFLHHARINLRQFKTSTQELRKTADGDHHWYHFSQSTPLDRLPVVIPERLIDCEMPFVIKLAKPTTAP